MIIYKYHLTLRIRLNIGRFQEFYTKFDFIYSLVLSFIELYIGIVQMQLDDTILRTIETAPNEELKEARDLILRIRRRNLYNVSWLRLSV